MENSKAVLLMHFEASPFCEGAAACARAGAAGGLLRTYNIYGTHVRLLLLVFICYGQL